ncbi:hypothetical protein R82526_02826 [Ralstonia mannitolilytica]|uniref:hypothetical protein n=1 Tax=Ralstonia mannitolilytica TaxID=105219 RepID=UPI000A6FFFD8|nr:hypothetical protein [Ralstonia mannitolilytica]CAJ0686504.1 hypothetical protein R82526_02826 [Ralstonia mannitolilytica]CAJ0894486.1 hypothetical protein R76727_04529 [Ralstonia mannitolilytica]
MSAFRPGWYEISFDASTRDRRCRYFKNPSAYTAECLLKSTGQQILLWHDPAGVNGPGKAAAWQPTYRPLDNAPKDDWWDNPPGGKSYNPELPPQGASLKELMKSWTPEIWSALDPGEVDAAVSDV